MPKITLTAQAPNLHYSRNGGATTMCGLRCHDDNGRTLVSWTNARMMTDCPDCIKAAQHRLQADAALAANGQAQA